LLANLCLHALRHIYPILGWGSARGIDCPSHQIRGSQRGFISDSCANFTTPVVIIRATPVTVIPSVALRLATMAEQNLDLTSHFLGRGCRTIIV